MKFTERFNECLHYSDLSQSDIAKYCNTTRQNISNFKAGRTIPSIETLCLLSECFNVSTDYLLGLADDFGNVVIKKEAPQLSAEELEIIENYRKLNPSGKKLIKQTFETLTFNTKIQRKKYTGD